MISESGLNVGAVEEYADGASSEMSTMGNSQKNKIEAAWTQDKNKHSTRFSELDSKGVNFE